MEKEGERVSSFDGKASAHHVEEDSGVSGPIVSHFDYSVENHFRIMDMISNVCGETAYDDFEQGEIDRFTSSVTFLSEWRHFNNEPRTVKLALDTGNNQEKNNVIVLPRFSAAAVPQPDNQSTQMASPKSRKDFLLYVGGLIWALDWCPRSESRESNTHCEFIAVSAHPPDSTYHKIGAPLSGRGMVQIWCLISSSEDKDIVLGPTRVPKRKYQMTYSAKEEEGKPKRPRGRPRKNKGVTQPQNSDATKDPTPDVGDACEAEFVEALAIQLPNRSLIGLPTEENIVLPPSSNEGPGFVTGTETITSSSAKKVDGSPLKEDKPKRPRGRPRKNKEENQLNMLKTRKRSIACENQFVEALAVQMPDCSLNGLPAEENMIQLPSPNERFPSADVEPITSSSTKKMTDGTKEEEAKPKKPRERPKKKEEETQPKTSTTETRPKRSTTKMNQMHTAGDSCKNIVEAPPLLLPDCSLNGLSTLENIMETPAPNVSVSDVEPITSSLKEKLKSKARIQKCSRNTIPTENAESAVLHLEREGLPQNDKMPDGNVENSYCSTSPSTSYAASKDAMIPRLVSCIAHDGKVAWDVKWKPRSSESGRKYQMGYLAVVLGNGSIEVWEVPSPRMIRSLFSSQHKEGIDPRFMKLNPIFRCSKLRYGDRNSMPLVVEWSTSPPHDYLLVGSHDGLVALWKFSPTGSFEETRPLLCFSADTVPIRSLAWAPSEGDPESSNVIVTAGHEGLKFWDLRDPFRPLWDINPVPRLIYSLDWLPDPRCVITSYDDGTLRVLSLAKAACDVPVTGKPFSGTHQQGLHSLYCSPFAIWSVHVSRCTGMVAYCGADGNALHFQLTAKAVEKDPHRNRAPHFLCGAVADEGSTIVVKTPSSVDPHPMKSSANEWAIAPRSLRGYVYKSNQARRLKNEMSTQKPECDEVLALCYRDEPESQDTSQSLEKCKANSRKKPTSDQGLAAGDPESTASKADGKGGTGDKEIETLPSKVVAMHRVRWNLNKGSERWLCYGGAAGILRCQEIFPPDTRNVF